MNERPAPSSRDTPPPAPVQAWRGGAGRLSLSHLFSFVKRQASPTLPRPTPTAAPRARLPHRAPVSLTPAPSRAAGRGAAVRGRSAAEGTHQSVRARPPAPRPRGSSRRCPRCCRRPALSLLGKLQAHVSPGAGRGRQWGGGGGEPRGHPRIFSQPGRRDRVGSCY